MEKRKIIQILYEAGIRAEPKSPYFKFRKLTLKNLFFFQHVLKNTENIHLGIFLVLTNPPQFVTFTYFLHLCSPLSHVNVLLL